MCFLAFLMLVVAVTQAPCRTWLVTPDGTGDQPSIKAALYYGADGDTVLLADGTYTGSDNTEVSYRGKAIVVMSESGDPHSCVIDCQGSETNWSRGFLFYYGEGLGSVLEGVTIKNGYGYEGGGIWCWASSPTISNVILTGNTALFSGGGVYCGEGSSPDIGNATIYGNSATDGGGLYCVNASSPYVRNSIIAYNTDGAAVRLADAESRPALTCCDIYGNVGGDWTPEIGEHFGLCGNISLDPLFCLGENPDRPFTVQNTSPCAPGALLECDGMGAVGVGCWLAVTSDIEIEPDVLNPRSKGRWISCYIELGDGLSAEDIDVATVRFNDSLYAEQDPIDIGDHDGDGIADLMVKFSRREVIALLAGFGDIEVRVSGEAGGLSFAGTDTLRVLYAEIKARPPRSGDDESPGRILSVSVGTDPGSSSDISFEIPDPGFVTLSIYDVQGRLVRRLVNEPMEPNTYVVDWNGLDQGGARVAGGVYFLRLESGNEVVTGKALVVR
jgi:hypothetical protein